MSDMASRRTTITLCGLLLELINLGSAAAQTQGTDRVRWRFQMDSWLGGRFVTVAPDGTVYASDLSKLYALTPDGVWVQYSTQHIMPLSGGSNSAFRRAVHAEAPVRTSRHFQSGSDERLVESLVIPLRVIVLDVLADRHAHPLCDICAVSRPDARLSGAARSDQGASPMTRGVSWRGSVRFCPQSPSRKGLGAAGLGRYSG